MNDTDKQAVKPLTPDQQTLAVLDHIMQRIYQVEGRSPNYVVYEGALAATGVTDGSDRTTIKADFNPDRWVVYFRPTTNGIVRVDPSTYVGANLPAVEISTGRAVKLPALNDTLSLLSTGADAVHYFAVAVGGGAEFEITAI